LADGPFHDHQPVSDGVKVYNIEVEGEHTYFVADNDHAQGTDPLWMHNKCVDGVFFGRYKKKPISYEGVTTKTLRVEKVPEDVVDAVERDFNNTARANFIRHIGANTRSELKAVGFSVHDLDIMESSGVVPGGGAHVIAGGFQFHHIHPKALGGDNSFGNLVLIQQRPYHSAITSEINALTRHMSPGDGQQMEIDLPTSEGLVVYAP
jgi:hypothetical protein